MIIGVPKEIKTEENRVAVTPTGVAGFVARNHKVLIQKGAGLGSGLTDRAYESAGATMVETAEDVWRQADMIMKVKEPQVAEYPLLRPGLILFTYLHLAANESVTRALLDRKVTAIGYETIQLDDGSLPLLAPMSEIAGRLSIQVGAWCLQAENGGRGILLGGASGVRPGAGLAEDLGGDHDAVARYLEVLEGLAGDLLGQPARIDVGGVDEVDAGVERLADQALGVGLLEVADLAPYALAAAEGHGAEAEFGDEKAGAAQGMVAHRKHSLCRSGRA